ncbi:hypothetical protein JXL19_08270, partial [bacterium]|nr:hypothetical protein [bacterium]
KCGSWASSGGGGGGMTVSGIMSGQGYYMWSLNNMWGSTNSSFTNYPWANQGQSGWGNMFGMMTNVDAYYNNPSWGGGIGYDPMDLMRAMNQYNNYMFLMNQGPIELNYYIPPAGQAAINFGPERIILPKIFDTRWPSPIPFEDRYWVGPNCFSGI